MNALIPPALHRTILDALSFGTAAVLVQLPTRVTAISIDAALRHLRDRGAPVHMARHARFIVSLGGTALVIDGGARRLCVARCGLDTEAWTQDMRNQA